MATPANVSYRATAVYKDHATRISSIKWNVSSADYTAWVTDTTAGNMFAEFAALDGMTLDDPQLRRVSRDADDSGVTPGASPDSEDAVNSAKLLILWADTVTKKKGRNEIPARNSASFASIRGLVDIKSGTRTAEVTALFDDWAAHALSEDGNPIGIYEIRVVGKGTAA